MMARQIQLFLFSFVFFVPISFTLGQNNLSNQWTKASDNQLSNSLNYISMINGSVLVSMNNKYISHIFLQNDSSKNNESYVECIAKDGTSLWHKKIQYSNNGLLRSVKMDSMGNVYFAGTFTDTMTIQGKSYISDAKTTLLLAKIDYLGTLKWYKAFPSETVGNKIFIELDTRNKLIYLAATYKGNIEYPTKQVSQEKDILIASCNIEDGRTLYLNLLGGVGDEGIEDFKVVKEKIYIAGCFSGTCRYKNKAIAKSEGKTDALFLALNPDMQIVFKKSIGGFYSDRGTVIDIDGNGNIFTGGVFSGDLYIEDRQFTNKGNIDAFICKYDAFSKLEWADAFGGLSNDYLSGIALDTHGNIFLAGNFRGEIRYNDFLAKSKQSLFNLFIAKYSQKGYLRYIEAITDTCDVFNPEIEIDNENCIYVSRSGHHSVSGSTLTDMRLLGKFKDCDYTKKTTLLTENSVCYQDSTINVSDSFKEYYWNSSKGTHIHKLDTASTYIVKVVDRFDCVLTDSIMIDRQDMEDFDVLASIENNTDTDGNQNEKNSKHEAQVEVYPNPVIDFIHTSISNLPPSEKIIVTVLSPIGTNLLQIDTRADINGSKQLDINLSDLAAGTYCLSVETGGDAKYLKKVIKK